MWLCQYISDAYNHTFGLKLSHSGFDFTLSSDHPVVMSQMLIGYLS